MDIIIGIKDCFFGFIDFIELVWDKRWCKPLEFSDLIVQTIIAIVAVFGTCIYKWWIRPKLEMTFKLEFPYFNKTKCKKTTAIEIQTNNQDNEKETINPYIATQLKNIDQKYCTCQYNSENAGLCNVNLNDQNDSTDNSSIPTLSYKLKIENRGRGDAQNVKVYLGKVEEIIDGEHKGDKHILPMNLMWSYQDNKKEKISTLPVLSPRMESFCDFIFVNKNNSSFITEVTVPVDDEFNNTISKGKYRAYLFISMSNYKSVEYFVDFTYNGWSDNQDEIIQFSEPCKFTIYNRFVNRLKRFFHCCSSSLK